MVVVVAEVVEDLLVGFDFLGVVAGNYNVEGWRNVSDLHRLFLCSDEK